MSGEAILFIYLGAVGAISILNAVQWSIFRDSVYGLFTLLVLIWFAHSMFNRTSSEDFPLSESQNMALYATSHSLVSLIYLEIVGRLFKLPGGRFLSKGWIRWVQLLLSAYLLAEVGMQLTNEPWHLTPVGRFVSSGLWILNILVYFLGMALSFRQRDAVGVFFGIGTLLMLPSEINNLFYYTGYPWTLPTEPVDLEVYIQILGGSRILQLLCFSLALLFRQHRLSVEKAVERTRREEQLVQDRLEAKLAVQRLEQEKTDVQLRALQVQVNPHFLFNSLNSLSSLIDDDPRRASQFVDQLSQVYRYLLRANEHSLTTLANELDFIRVYYALLKTRYGNALELDMLVSSESQTQLLPPLTLQLLVENAVKHNITSAKRPLRITIFTDKTGHLTVSNNLQRKKTPVISNGIGLSTILTQYQKLMQPVPKISENEAEFAVTIRLIHPQIETA
jgi:hypothetical protein